MAAFTRRTPKLLTLAALALPLSTALASAAPASATLSKAPLTSSSTMVLAARDGGGGDRGPGGDHGGGGGGGGAPGARGGGGGNNFGGMNRGPSRGDGGAGPRVERNFERGDRVDRADRGGRIERGDRGRDRDVVVGDRDGRGHGDRRHVYRDRHGRVIIGGGYYGYPYWDDDFYDDDVGYAYDTASADDIDRCRDRYRSFDPATGTFLGYDGERHVCPYLR